MVLVPCTRSRAGAAILAGIAALAIACGQPQIASTQGGRPVPAAAAVVPSVRVYPTLTPSRPTPGRASKIAGVPTLPGGVPTKMPTPATIVAAPSVVPDRGPLEKPTPDPKRPEPTYVTPHADSPVSLTVAAARAPNTRLSSRSATTIVVATVRQVQPAGWTTPDGRRPANPHRADSPYSITTPVLLDVEQYLKGPQPQCQLLLFAQGGSVGQDSVRRIDGLSAFAEGERVIVFLSVRGIEPREHGGFLVWELNERYTVLTGGVATNNYRTIALQQLLQEIIEAER